MKKYKPVRDEFLIDAVCSIQVEGCTWVATTCHHPEGKISEEDLLNKKIPACLNCHRWADDHPAAAKAIAVSGSRLNKKI